MATADTTTPVEKRGIEDVALHYLNALLNGQVRYSGWWAELLRAFRLEHDYMDDPHACMGGTPDGYLKLYMNGRVWLIAVEVEDTNPLTRAKLKMYADFYMLMDGGEKYGIGLITTDRYGRPTVHDLLNVWFAFRGRRGPGDFVPTSSDEESIEPIAEACRRHRHHAPVNVRHERRMTAKRRERLQRQLAADGEAIP
jgi:hypothetical protein